MINVVITPPSFAKTDDMPLKLLDRLGITYSRNISDMPYSKQELIERLRDADGLVLGVEMCSREVLECAPRLKVISRYGVGTDNVDLGYCREKGIAFYRTAGVNADAVADSTFALILAVSKKIASIDADVRAGRWYEPETYEINGKTLGLLGFGNIGSKVARRAAGFEMTVIAYDPCRNEALAKECGVRFADTIAEVLAKADIICLHLPLSPETHHLIGEREIALMRPKSILINTARGGIIDEIALADALRQNRILGAGLDVFEHEPIEADNPLLKLSNVILSPHSAADTFETTRKVSLASAQNLLAGLGLA